MATVACNTGYFIVYWEGALESANTGYSDGTIWKSKIRRLYPVVPSKSSPHGGSPDNLSSSPPGTVFSHHSSLKSARPMIILRISLVPAPISNSLASLRRRPVGYSLTYPLPPRHCIACNKWQRNFKSGIDLKHLQRKYYINVLSERILLTMCSRKISSSITLIKNKF